MDEKKRKEIADRILMVSGGVGAFIGLILPGAEVGFFVNLLTMVLGVFVGWFFGGFISQAFEAVRGDEDAAEGFKNMFKNSVYILGFLLAAYGLVQLTALF